jgi:hypothetical protein
MYPGESQDSTARGDLVCQHQSGSGARLDGKVNRCEPMLNLVIINRLKVLRSLDQKWCAAGCSLFVWEHTDDRAAGE